MLIGWVNVEYEIGTVDVNISEQRVYNRTKKLNIEKR